MSSTQQQGKVNITNDLVVADVDVLEPREGRDGGRDGRKLVVSW